MQDLQIHCCQTNGLDKRWGWNYMSFFKTALVAPQNQIRRAQTSTHASFKRRLTPKHINIILNVPIFPEKRKQRPVLIKILKVWSESGSNILIGENISPGIANILILIFWLDISNILILEGFRCLTRNPITREIFWLFPISWLVKISLSGDFEALEEIWLLVKYEQPNYLPHSLTISLIFSSMVMRTNTPENLVDLLTKLFISLNVQGFRLGFGQVYQINFFWHLPKNSPLRKDSIAFRVLFYRHISSMEPVQAKYTRHR